MILSLENLSVITLNHHPRWILRDISLHLAKGETLAIIGESGAGKSTLSKALLGILPGTLKTRGTLKYFGQTPPVIIDKWNEENFQQIRGSQIGIVFQNSTGSINPLFKCGEQIRDIQIQHTGDTDKAGVLDILTTLDFNNTDDVYNLYPHQLSGGMAQRVSLALALSGRPQVLIADEPTSSLDTISRQKYLKYLDQLREKEDLALVIITHDLEDALTISDTTLVCYLGRAVEYRKTNDLVRNPAHPYTQALLTIYHNIQANSLPQPIPGNHPSGNENIPGCPFHPRCPKAKEICRTTFPEKHSITESAYVCCHFPDAIKK